MGTQVLEHHPSGFFSPGPGGWLCQAVTVLQESHGRDTPVSERSLRSATHCGPSAWPSRAGQPHVYCSRKDRRPADLDRALRPRSPLLRDPRPDCPSAARLLSTLPLVSRSGDRAQPCARHGLTCLRGPARPACSSLRKSFEMCGIGEQSHGEQAWNGGGTD